MSIEYPKTKEEWWTLVNEHWDDLKNLIETFHPARKNTPEMTITASRAEALRQVLSAEFTRLDDYEKMREEQDVKLANVLEETYWGIPESIEVWQYPKFGLLCDLCSESYVLREENEN